MKHSTFLFGLLAAILSLLSVQTAQAGEKLTISSASAYKSNGTEWTAYSGSISNVKDGNTTTRYWSDSNQAKDNYIKIELADLSVLGSVTLRFDSSSDQAQNAAIEYSTNGTDWTRAVAFTSSDIASGVYSYNFTNAPTAQYLRMIITQASNKWLIMYEFEVYGPSENQVSTTFHYDAGGTYQFDVVKSYDTGTELTLAEVNDISYFKGFAFNTENLTVSEENKEFTVTCTPDFPFTEGHVYKMHGDNYNGDQQRVNASDYCFTARTVDNYITYKGVKAAVDAYSYWTFEHVAGTQDQFYVYNMGVGKYLSSKTQRQPAIMAEKGLADGANQIFRITPNGNGFNLQHQGNNYCCGTHINGTRENPYLGTAWGAATDPSHDASRVYIMDIASELAALGNDPATTEGYVGEGPSQVLKTAAADAGETPTKANVVACLDAYNNPKLADYVASNKYYQIFFVSSDNTTNKALTLNNAIMNYNSGNGSFSLDTSNTAMAVTPVAEASLSQTDFIASLYTLPAGTNGMTVKNVNANVPWGDVNTSGLLATTGAGTEYPFVVVSGQGDNSRWNIRTVSGYLAFNSAQYENAIVNNTTSGTTARLKEVTSIPVTIKNTLWTSLCFPVDVVIPANLKAYKAASTQGMTINLEELAAGSRIPAGNGFLALAEAGGD